MHIAGGRRREAGTHLSVGNFFLHLGKIVHIHRHINYLRHFDKLPIYYMVFWGKVNDDRGIPLIFCTKRDRIETQEESGRSARDNVR